jgi:cyanophycinase
MKSISPGTVALVGSGEFLPPIEPLDRVLLERLHEKPRVVVLPTASAPDGPGVPERWAKMGVAHFTRLDALVEPIMLLTRADAESSAQAGQIAASNFVYFSGGKPQYLLATLRDTPCWQAIQSVYNAGGVVAGCSAGAMVLGAGMVDFPRLWRTLPALALAPDVAVIPHFDEMPRLFTGLARPAARQMVIAGVDGSTALVYSNQQWCVLGRGTVTIFTSQGKQVYRAGETVQISR